MPNLFPGDPAPWFTAPTRSNPRFVFSSVAGRYVVLMFVPSYASEGAQAAMQAVRASASCSTTTRRRCSA